MKKLMVIAAACVALVGCAKNELDGLNNAQERIGFQAVTGLQDVNRATFDDDETFVATGWVVPEGKTFPTGAARYIDNQVVAYNTYLASTWTTATAYYWPAGGATMTFFAHYPATVTATWDGSTYTFAGYNSDTHDEDDFLVADVQNGRTYANSGTTGVPVTFRHKLTQVAFNVGFGSATPGVSYQLKSIVLKKIGKVATFTQSNDGTTTTEAWSTPTTTANYTIFSGSLNVTADLSVGGATPNAITTTKTLFIPQTLTGASFVVTYDTITTLAGIESKTTVEKEVTFDVAHAATAVWDDNQLVTYTLKIKDDSKRITWQQPTIEGWTPISYTVEI